MQKRYIKVVCIFAGIYIVCILFNLSRSYRYMNQIKSDMNQIKSDMNQIKSGMNQIKSGMNQIKNFKRK